MASREPMSGQKRRRAFWSVLFGGVLLMLGHVALWGHLEYGEPTLRDPEFGRRLKAAKARQAEHPNAKLVLVLGSSRVAMGVRPGVVHGEAVPGTLRGPMLVNFSLAGSGPIMELMAMRRTLAAGVKPAAILVEYWPAFWREDGPYHEDARLDPTRMNQADWPIIQEYFRPEHLANVNAQWRTRQLNSWFGHRKSLMNQMAHSWLHYNDRSEAMWERIDRWGWLPGRESLDADQFPQALKSTERYYKPLFANYSASPIGDDALKQLVELSRASDIPVSLLYLPESAAFVNLMPPVAQELARRHLAQIQQKFNLPLIDARGWVKDDQLPDGFHLMQPGAAELTRKLLPAVESIFPQLKASSP